MLDLLLILSCSCQTALPLYQKEYFLCTAYALLNPQYNRGFSVNKKNRIPIFGGYGFLLLVDDYRFDSILIWLVDVMCAEVNPSSCFAVVADTDKLVVHSKQVFSVTVQ